MNHDTTTRLARIAVRESLARRDGDELGAAEARAEFDALALTVNGDDWAETYRTVLCDSRHG